MRLVLLAALAAAPAAAQSGSAVLYPLPGQPAVVDVPVVPMGDVRPAHSSHRPAAPATLDLYGRPSRIASERDVVIGGRSVVGRWLALRVEGDRRATRDLADETLVKVLVINPGGFATLRGIDRRAGAAPEVFVGDVIRTRGSAAALAFDGLDGAAGLALEGRRLVLTDPLGRRTVFLRLVGTSASPAFSTDALVLGGG